MNTELINQYNELVQNLRKLGEMATGTNSEQAKKTSEDLIQIAKKRIDELSKE